MTLPGVHTPSPRPPRHPLAVLGWVTLLAATALLHACSSRPTPAAQPKPAADADRLARQAARLQADENWTGAAGVWQRTARQFHLLHRNAEAALAQHNEAVSRRALGQFEQAHALLESAAAANQSLALTNAWWRNQIALLQLEIDHQPDLASARFDQLQPRFPELDPFPGLAALRHHEEARLRLAQNRAADAMAAAHQATLAFQAAQDRTGLASVALTRGRILQQEQDPAAAENAWREALALFESLSHPRGIALALAGLGSTLAQHPDPTARAQARDILAQAVANLRALRLDAAADDAARTLETLNPAPPSDR